MTFLIPSIHKSDFRQADWENIKDKLQGRFSDPELMDKPSLDDMDTCIEHWTRYIKTTMSNNITATHRKTLPHPKLDHHTKTLIIQFNTINRYANINEWALQLY